MGELVSKMSLEVHKAGNGDGEPVSNTKQDQELQNLKQISLNAYKKEVNRRKILQWRVLAYPRPYPPCNHKKNKEPFPFQRLPLELRQEIYQLVLPPRRTIHIHRGGGDLGLAECKKPGHESRDVKAAARAGPVPNLLHVCQESRAFALKTYQLHFAENLQKGPIYFNVEKDRLYFEHSLDMMYFFNRKSLKERPETLNLMSDAEDAVRSIVITTWCLSSPTLPMVTRFRNLETLNIVNLWVSAADRITPRNEKLMVKNWRTNAKKGGWECKIPKLDTYPSFAPKSQLAVRDLVG